MPESLWPIPTVATVDGDGDRRRSESGSVLLVEGLPAEAALTQAALESASRRCWRVRVAGTLAEALDSLACDRPDVVMLDLNLPDSEGLQTVRRLREAVPETPVVVLGSRDDEDLAVEAVRLGAQDYFIRGHLDPSNMLRALAYAIERKELERQRRQTQALVESFTTMASHELRIPLTAIKEGIRLVCEEALGPLSPDQRETLTVVQNNVRRLHRLIDHCLEYQRLQAGRMPFAWAPVDVCQVLREVLEAMCPLAQRKRLTLAIEAAPGLPAVRGDRDRLLQVLTHLVGNALAFTRTGGVWLRATVLDGQVELSVRDTGCGMTADQVERVFDRFHPVGDRPGSRRTGGSGLGLAICREIVEAHGGRIWAESQPERGTCMTVRLPVWQDIETGEQP